MLCMEKTGKTGVLRGMSPAGTEVLKAYLEKVSYERNGVITNEGDENKYVYFVEEGLVRGYIGLDGREATFSFSFEGDPVVSTFRPKAIVAEVAMEPTILLRINRERLEWLFAVSLELANWGRKIMERSFFDAENYFVNYFWKNKAEQYALLLREHPRLLQRVPLKDIASYLNVTPQSLSRIRAKTK